ncbi:MAG: hypothetical protein ACJ73N_09470 [Bryobacteraceae bacterium]
MKRPEPPLLSISQACAQTGLSRKVLLALAKSGVVASFNLPSRRCLLRRADLENLARRGNA